MNQELDPTAYTKYFGGIEPGKHSNVYFKCTDRFLTSIDGRLEQLKISIDQVQTLSVVNYAHQLKGSMRTLGGEGIAHILAKIENDAPNMNLEEQRKCFDEIFTRTQLFKKELQEFVETIRKANAS